MQKGAEREFAATSHADAVPEQLFQNCFQHRFISGQMQFREWFTGEAAAAGPVAECRRDGSLNTGPAHAARESTRHFGFPPCSRFAVR
jgi:hypothetical protein